MTLQDAFAKAVAALEYAAPSSPGHRCGPEAGCDLACEEYAGWCGAMAALLQVQAELPELLTLMSGFVRLSDSMAREWKQGDWHAVLVAVRSVTEGFRAALAKAGDP